MKTAHKLMILLVEDEQNVRAMIAFLLQDAGFQVLQAANGRDALTLLEKVAPDLIVSDIMMPGMSGFEFCKRVRDQSDLAQVPFIFLSARGERKDVRQGMILGADDYLIKPFEAEDLLTAIEVRLARAAEAQAAIDRASADLQSHVIRALTHEFRTPLSLVVGYTDLLKSAGHEMDEDDFRVILQGLHSGSERLMGLVEDFLLLSRLRTGDIAWELEQAPRKTSRPDQVIAQVVAQFASTAAKRNVSITVDENTPDTVVVISDHDLAQIVSRLVDNAIKFAKTEGGQVEITTRQQEGKWAFDIVDHGVGIRQEALAWIFEAFRQVDRQKMEQQGSGVGLTIVQGLTEVYGGEVAVTSTPGEGSTFTVRLPLAGQ